MDTLRNLSFRTVWLAPEHTVQTGLFVMRGHQMKQLPIVKNQSVLGYVNLDDIERSGPDTSLADHLHTFPKVLSADLSLKQAATLFIQDDLTSAPVQDGSAFLGLLTSNMILKGLVQNADSLTGLSWSNLLREWGASQLANAVEVCLLAVDLDQFGKVNATIGHSKADTILQALADHLVRLSKTSTDVVVRVTGDKFIIGSTRSLAEMERLEETIQSQLPKILSEGHPIPIGLHTGIAGGRRTHERASDHPEANIDDLISLALNAARKGRQTRHAVVQVPSSVQSVQLIAAGLSDSGRSATVKLKINQLEYLGSHEVGDQPIAAAIARAFAAAFNLAHGSLHLEFDMAASFREPSGTFLANVEGNLSQSNRSERIAGSASGASLETATAMAALASLNLGDPEMQAH